MSQERNQSKRAYIAHTLLASLLLFCSGCQQAEDPTPAADLEPVPQVCCGGESSSAPIEPVPGILSNQLKTVPQGPELSHTFTVENKSSTEVAVFEKPPQVNLPCCVTAELSATEIPPGETAQLKVSYKTRTRPGPFDLFIRLSPKGGDVVEQYHLSGQVEKSFVVTPKKLNLAAQRTQEFVVSGALLDREYKIKEVKTNSTHLKVSEVKRENDQITYELSWDGKPVEVEVPVVYVITDSEVFGWAPVLVKGVGQEP